MRYMPATRCKKGQLQREIMGQIELMSRLSAHTVADCSERSAWSRQASQQFKHEAQREPPACMGSEPVLKFLSPVECMQFTTPSTYVCHTIAKHQQQDLHAQRLHGC